MHESGLLKPEALIVGIDGGQTSSKGVLTTLQGKVLAQGSSGPILHLASRNSDRQLIESIRGLLRKLWNQAELSPTPLAAIALGLTGVTTPSSEAEQVAELTGRLVQANQILVRSDAFAALKGAHAGKPGVIVISGTGMVAMGLDTQGCVARCGGWGWVLGDRGSAFSIGRSGLRAALEAFDGTAPKTILIDLFIEHFQVARMKDIKRIYMAHDFGARAFGQLAAIVSTAALGGDQVSLGIIEDNSVALARVVVALVEKLNFGGQEIPLSPIGGAFAHVHMLREGFERQLKKHPGINIRIVPAEFPPAFGAALIALESCGVLLDHAIPNLRQIHEDSEIFPRLG